MTPLQQRGRILVIAFIAGLLLLDLSLRILLLVSGHLHAPHVVGTVLTVILCWALWRGNRAAYALFLAGFAFALLYVLWRWDRYSIAYDLCFLLFFSTSLGMLVTRSTRSFLEHRRDAVADDAPSRP